MKKLDFGTKLIEVRKAKGLTQDEVAEKCKITVRTIQRIESGLVMPRAFTIKVICETLGFDFFEASNTGYEALTESQNSNLENHKVLWYLKDLFNLKTNAMKKISVLSISLLMIGFLFVFIVETKAQSENQKGLNGLTIQFNEVNSIKKIEAVFTNNLTLDSLVSIKNELKVKGITVNYKLIEFDASNHLLKIDCEVNCNDGYSGSFAIGMLNSENKAKRLGFYRDDSKNAAIPFGTGGFKN
jgi:transcriptional regulator with XRE-family HTH domain